MNAREVDVSKSLIVAFGAALLAASPLSAAEPTHRPGVVSSGRSISRDARGAWFRQHVEDILVGRTTILRGRDAGR